VVNRAGEITLTADVSCRDEAPALQRFGIRMGLESRYDSVEYFGYGPHESYVDKHQSCYIGRFKKKVAQMGTDYLKPQENGNRYRTEWAAVTDGGEGLLVCGAPFDFSALCHSQEELMAAAHNFELQPRAERTVLCVDYRQSGVGSNSCGPKLAEKYQLEKEFTFEVTLRPIARGDLPEDIAAMQYNKEPVEQFEQLSL
jgi:beta-galactosidase